MHLYKYIFLGMLTIISGPASAIVKYIITYEGSDDNNNTKIEIWCDDHFNSTKEENQQQLKLFIEKWLTKKQKTHVYVESKFFHNIDIKSTSLTEFFNTLQKRLGWSYFEAPFSLESTPQSDEATTWIAWDLPYVLMHIFKNQNLPSPVELNEQGRNLIIENVDTTFFDSRIRFSQKIANPEDPVAVEAELKNNFQEAKQSSPKKVALKLEEYSLQINSLAASDTNSSSELPSYNTLFDVELITKIIPNLFLSDPNSPKRIIILCGELHARRLDKLLPELNFKNRRVFSLQKHSNPAPSSTTSAATNQVRRRLNFDS